MALCTLADVEALAGVPVASDDRARVDRLIEMASGLVANACRALPSPPPPEVSMVTATVVVRQMANPTGLVSEGIAGYNAAYGAGMVLTEEDLRNLGPWASPDAAGRGAYSVALGSGLPAWPVLWWQRDWDNIEDWERVP